MADDLDFRALASVATLADRLRRPIDVSAPVETPGSRHAAVLIVLYEHLGAAHLILTRRADHLPHHPGQVSLPGGRFEPDDGSLSTTALRETWEEIGVPPDALDLVRQLPEVHTRVSGFLVTPFVAVAHAPIAPVVADGEIARLIEVPLAELVAADAALPEHPTLATLRYPLDGEDVWGATARILSLFVAVLRTDLRTRDTSPQP